jgi:hypothetical protein
VRLCGLDAGVSGLGLYAQFSLGNRHHYIAVDDSPPVSTLGGMKPFVLCLLFSVVVARAELIRGQVELAGVKGTITAKSGLDQVTRTLDAGSAIREDDELVTSMDGAAELSFSNGVRVLVAPSTKFRLSMFRQVKMPLPGRLRAVGELPDDGSILDLTLRAGRFTVVCPPLQDRSLVSVRTPQGRSDLRREGVYELSLERSPGGESVAQALVLVGGLKFTPIGRAKPLDVEANNKLLVTSDLAAPTQIVLEKLKMETAEVEGRLKGGVFVPSSEVISPLVPGGSSMAPPASSTGPTFSSQTAPTASGEVMLKVTQEVLDRQAQTNPSPAGG